jgi:hypothetical protein
MLIYILLDFIFVVFIMVFGDFSKKKNAWCYETKRKKESQPLDLYLNHTIIYAPLKHYMLVLFCFFLTCYSLSFVLATVRRS